MGWSAGMLASLLLAVPPLPPDRAAMVVAWNDAHGLAPLSDEIRAEIGSILGAAGIDVVFSSAPAGEPPVVTVVVSPSQPSGPGWRLAPHTMGVFLSVESSSVVFVFHHRVANALGHSGQPPSSPSERRDLARALARVAVHEIVHRLAPEAPHADVGLMQERLGRSILTRERVSLDETSRTAIRAAVERNRPLVARRPNE